MAVVGYPPEHHLLRDLRIETEAAPGLVRAWIPVVDALCDESGTVRAGVLATLVDVMGGGLAAVAAAPGWIATADLTLHLLAPARRGPLAAVGTVIRRGRTTVVIGTDVTDGDEVPVATATMTFSVLDRRDSNPVITPPDGPPQRTSMARPDSGLRVPFLEALGIVDRPDGAALTPVPYVANSLGGVQGGVVAGLAERAAAVVAADAFGAPARVVDLQVTYLALCKAGPIVARAQITGATPERASVSVELHDEGAARLATRVRASAVPMMGGRW